MDLNVLFAHQVSQLKHCYAELGHAPQRLQEALQAAIEHEVERTVKEVEEAKAQIDGLVQQCEAYKRTLSADGASINVSTGEDRFHRGTFLARIEAWQAELSKLQRQYLARRTHVDRLIESLDGYRPILDDFVPVIEGNAGEQSDASHQHVQPIPSLKVVETALASCADELQSRTESLQADLNEIQHLWSDLALLPSSDDDLDGRILRHLGITPRLVDVGEGCMDFCGDFDENLDGCQDDDAQCETPSRKSGSQQQLSGKPSMTQPGSIIPRMEVLALVQDKRAELEAERTRRTEMLQELYDELIPLWRRFDVADEDVDAFVQANCGCTLTVLEAYESELRQMRELKSQHMALFISKVREDIANLWDQLMMTADERRESFPHFFYDLTDAAGGGEGGIEPSDELLALHEEKVRDLDDELATRARPLELVRQYTRLLDEARELEESAKDTSRLMSRGTGQRRDPGRLLREEKMRKRIKIIKPKVEEELLKTIPAWEEESGRPFIVNGARFLDTVDIQTPQSKKRPRTISNSQPSNAQPAATATPQMPVPKRTHVEGSAPRSVSASAASTIRKGQQQSQPTPTGASGRGRNVTGPLSSVPTPVSQPRSRIAQPSSAARSRNAAMNGASMDVSRTTTSISSVSLASQATDATTHVLKSASRTNSMQPPVRLPAKVQVAKVRNGMPNKRPSLLLEASLRHAPRPSSDFVKPTSTGAGTVMRPLQPSSLHHVNSVAANDSLGPNWAVLDEDEENLLML